MTRIKACGFTRVEDVRLAASLGAWALGFVLTESPRHVSPARAAGLLAGAGLRLKRTDDPRPQDHTPHAVAVVATESPAWIAAALEEAGLDAVQLSAGADGPSVAAVRDASAALKRRPLVIAAADTPDAHDADLILIDVRRPGLYGGTGETLDWQALAADPPAPSRDLILAGGLHAGNVTAAIQALHPSVVDVSSGIETSPGCKDHSRLRDFFHAVEQADRALTAAGATPDSQATTRRVTG